MNAARGRPRRIDPANIVATIAPTAAPVETPRMYGSASGFFSSPWYAAPATESAAPTTIPFKTRGMRTSAMMDTSSGGAVGVAQVISAQQILHMVERLTCSLPTATAANEMRIRTQIRMAIVQARRPGVSRSQRLLTIAVSCKAMFTTLGRSLRREDDPWEVIGCD